MHGAGNDYIYIDATNITVGNPAELARRMSNRHKGVGADGLVLIQKSSIADFKMSMFNADGSEGKMCGNASRCIAKYVHDKGLTDKTAITLETLAGIKRLAIRELASDKVKSVEVDMGEPAFSPADIPTTAVTAEGIKIITSKGCCCMDALSMGNPHAVLFVDDVSNLDICTIGNEIQHNSIFPEQVNVEFAEVLNAGELRMRVWERGSGETQACGTGACAAVVAAAKAGRCSRTATVHLPGGDLHIDWTHNNHVYMTGGCETVFEGIYEYDNPD